MCSLVSQSLLNCRVVEVPLGTIVSLRKGVHTDDSEDDSLPQTTSADAGAPEVLADLWSAGATVTVAQGGQGGRGNAAFGSRQNRCCCGGVSSACNPTGFTAPRHGPQVILLMQAGPAGAGAGAPRGGDPAAAGAQGLGRCGVCRRAKRWQEHPSPRAIQGQAHGEQLACICCYSLHSENLRF